MTKSNFSVKMLSATLPANVTVIDSVCTDRFPLGAVLVQYPTGIYALIIAGAVHSCNQTEAMEYARSIGK